MCSSFKICLTTKYISRILYNTFEFSASAFANYFMTRFIYTLIHSNVERQGLEGYRQFSKSLDTTGCVRKSSDVYFLQIFSLAKISPDLSPQGRINKSKKKQRSWSALISHNSHNLHPLPLKQDGTALSELMSFNFSYFNFPQFEIDFQQKSWPN